MKLSNRVISLRPWAGERLCRKEYRKVDERVKFNMKSIVFAQFFTSEWVFLDIYLQDVESIANKYEEKLVGQLNSLKGFNGTLATRL